MSGLIERVKEAIDAALDLDEEISPAPIVGQEAAARAAIHETLAEVERAFRDRGGEVIGAAYEAYQMNCGTVEKGLSAALTSGLAEFRRQNGLAEAE